MTGLYNLDSTQPVQLKRNDLCPGVGKFFVNLLYFNVNSALCVQHVFLVHTKVCDRTLFGF